jgi:cell division transport system permease protein
MFKKYWKFSLRSWARETSLRASTLLILVFTYAVTLFLINSALNFKKIINRWGDATKLTVYLTEGGNESTREAIHKFINTLGEVKDVRFIPQDEAVAQFSSKNSIFSQDFLNDLKSQEVFPESFEVTLKGSLKDESYFPKMIEASNLIEKQLGVDEVSYGQGWIERYSAFIKLSNSLIGVIVVLFIFASLLIISNLIRVLVYNQQEEIEILELIGETARNIRLPFVMEGVFFSLVAFVAGITLNVVIFNWISGQLADSTMLSHLSDVIARPSLTFLFYGIGISLIVGGISAYFTVRSINNGWALSSRMN